MTPDLASRHLVSIARAWNGANLCKQRLANDEAASARELGGRVVYDLSGYPAHDADYYAWEAVRIVKIAEKTVKAGLRGKDDVQRALDDLRAGAPHMEDFRNEVTHVEDNRGADDVVYFAGAVRLQPDGGVDYVLDPRYEHHDLLGELVTVTETALRTFAFK